MIDATVERRKRLTRVVRLVIDSSYPGTIGGGLLNFAVESLPGGLCDGLPPVPEHATITLSDLSLKALSRDRTLVGQVATLQCEDTYQFADTLTEVTTEPPAPQPIKAQDLSEGSWAAWQDSPCSSTCGPGTKSGSRSCSVPGMCRGDSALEAVPCDTGPCRKYHK